MVLPYHVTVNEAFEPVLVVLSCCVVFAYLILTVDRVTVVLVLLCCCDIISAA